MTDAIAQSAHRAGAHTRRCSTGPSTGTGARIRVAGSGPAILLIHGIGDNSTTWSTVQSKLAQRFTVIAPDLLGHGKSDKPRADYSVAAYANGMRDLLSVLDIERVTVVGHSLGGGVAMQFAYQFPQLVDRLILVGRRRRDQGRQHRAAHRPLPMGTEASGAAAPPAGAARAAGGRRVAGAMFGIDRPGPRHPRCAAHPRRSTGADRVVGLRPHAARVVDWRGQVVTMLDRCYLTESVPVQLIWGRTTR